MFPSGCLPPGRRAGWAGAAAGGHPSSKEGPKAGVNLTKEPDLPEKRLHFS